MITIETELINSTIDALKELISRPPLTEKLLSRPPFKYILDICKAVSAATGFPSPESCNYDDITDREERTAFLTSIIGQITDQLGVPVDVQIKSILAGKDVPKTLRMLVMLAQAAKLFKVRSNSSQPPPQQAPRETVASPPQEDLEALAREKAEKERQRREQEQQERERKERERQEKEREEREKHELESRERAEAEQWKQKQQQQQQQQQSAISPQKSPPKVRFADDDKTRVEEHQPVIERPHFNRPPPSQHSRRMAVTATSEPSAPQPSAMRLVKVVREESSDESNQDLNQNAGQDGGFTMGLDAEWCDEMLPGEFPLDTGAPAPSSTHGELVANILDTAEAYNVALHGDGSKKPTGLSTQRDKKPIDSYSQPVQKLISHISAIIRKSVPYAKHTAFLDEHILTMRTELHTASEAVTKLLSTSLKQESSLKQANNACESKLHSLKEQIYSLRQAQLELLHSTLAL
ncbi:MT associated TRAF3 interacting protein [Giardia duodenalis]|uniref:Intraflagellar transport protein 54 n=1 Tax=Giardia intestinalis (strain ATCC 50803 / WB clone C6) TaxID=184922 RepID=IFT54_GIAIC|nr:MT associated TRAF3 interacting protein [Giardia intestinalis]A8B976.1 RecName: Full=Intraflagellar transport protein 54; Short=IFT54; AltName: Full=MT associated TRAF3 interacting protein [Giardia lamblia ATCC 50803]KAE8302308.1 MT associated TRAF3 interacting protein [Giardia intestinalis]|eukprot:XP_001708788.1 Hypothetical protein GL50803_9098 [Giardia lamblia ATCC 50803]